ncbi:hypothetical protein MXD61_09345 [Frankia sp. AgPm24]|uniref:hypothetical protein n=1 Tax=Frankia sp. AgPm24 TaxID=631128 RepID=UPI00200E6ECA|nr:hypothetical protein [Frankia sp. AgPm24]MCK9922083.1 hypothetical protein [Frankia sp. AgPm24]
MTIDDRALDDLLRRADPVSLEALPGGDQATAVRLLERRIQPLPRRRRYRIRVLVAVPVAAAVVGATAAAAVVLSSGPATSALSHGCYAAVSLHASTAVLGDDGGDPVDSCRRVWQTAFGQPAPAVLSACVSATGKVAVFPGATACRELELREFDGSFTAEAQRFAAFKRDAVAAMDGRGCLAVDAAAVLVRQLLTAHDLAGWTVDTGDQVPSDADRPCASLAFDEAHHVVYLPRI